ncbi:putative ABC-type Co2+ transport system, permease component [Cupriavidus taiwanensis]|uniref:DUF2523 domain-containing protein n=1 Tax=Cupriavidus taiwanensis TaxID=164546 RepID=UPI000E1878AE|nr:DUF2523 domain-containing protein [Cupriavidus taiwanensis]SPA23024.1 putative ABC-type Co2+ transport system, permease component [Cupriavidus taiwanensis]
MPIWLLAVLGGLAWIVTSLVGRVLLALGLGYVSFTGLSAWVGSVKDLVLQNLYALPPEFVSVMSLVKLDTCVSILFSAISVRLVLEGLSSDTITKMVIRP